MAQEAQLKCRKRLQVQEIIVFLVGEKNSKTYCETQWTRDGCPKHEVKEDTDKEFILQE